MRLIGEELQVHLCFALNERKKYIPSKRNAANYIHHYIVRIENKTS